MTNDSETEVGSDLVYRAVPDPIFGGFWFQNLATLVGDVANWELSAYGVKVTVVNSGVDFTYKGNTVDLTDISLDVKTGTIDAEVTVDGFSAGDIALLKLGRDGTVTLTKTTADIIDALAGRDVVSDKTTINLAELLGPWGWPVGVVSPPIIRPMPIIDPAPVAASASVADPGPIWVSPPIIIDPIPIDPFPVLHGETIAVLSGLKSLEADGLSIKALGSATLGSFAGDPTLLMPITGGSEYASGYTTDHSGSGVELSFKGDTLDLTNFVINDARGTVQADVAVDGHNEGLDTILHIASDGALTLSAGLARLIDAAVGSNVVSSNTVIGGAYSLPQWGWGFEPFPIAVSTVAVHPG